MGLPEGWGTLGPFTLLEKLKKAFKDKYKGRVEERLVQLVQKDVEETNPDWNKE